MAKIKDPVLFSAHFSIDPKVLGRLGVFDPVLNADTKLFIDPLLLGNSRHIEIKTNARQSWKTHFEAIIKLLRASQAEGDLAWRNARRRFVFHEITGTCLGYGSNTIRGSGFGEALTDQVLGTASQIVAMGINDPDLFVLMSLFEEGIGPDRISDMTTNVIAQDLISFTERICKKLNLPTQLFKIGTHSGQLPRNPTQKQNSPIVLVPSDILRDLPVAMSREDISSVVFENEMLRQGVSVQVGEIWKAKTRQEKLALRDLMLSSPVAFKSLISAAAEAEKAPYDENIDPKGLLVWRPLRESVARDYPFTLALSEKPTPDDLFALVRKIVKQFQTLVEDKGLWKMMYHGEIVRPEHNAQMLFFAVADAYCKANNIDISPEADAGNGPVDFKLSKGYNHRVLVEVKLSKNPKIVTGYTSQLEIYRKAEETVQAVYLILDVGSMGNKLKQLQLQYSNLKKSGHPVSEIVVVDALPKESASKRK